MIFKSMIFVLLTNRGISSVGQSAAFAMQRSGVRLPYAPPEEQSNNRTTNFEIRSEFVALLFEYSSIQFILQNQPSFIFRSEFVVLLFEYSRFESEKGDKPRHFLLILRIFRIFPCTDLLAEIGTPLEQYQ